MPFSRQGFSSRALVLPGRLATLLCLGSVMAFSSPVAAHHSLSMYDRSQKEKITGTVKEFEWMNPHSWIHVVVSKPGGGTEEWKFEGAGVGRLERAGWSKDMMKPGDRVVVEYSPRREGTGGGLFQSVTMADGKTYFSGFGQPGGYR